MFNSDMVCAALSQLQELMEKPEYAKYKDDKRVMIVLFAKILNDMQA